AFRPAEPAPTTVAMIASPTTTPTLPEPTIAPPTATPTKLPSPTPIPTATPTPDLAGPVREAIQADPDLSKLNIQVRQEGSSVWLEGEVPTLGVKYQLEALAKTIPGVRLVDVSNLRVVYTIGAGDTLWDISLAMYGRASLWRFIAAANQLSNPRLINPGRALIIPPPG
ncbi:MAG TPA: LysM peptidoglycan-binding domain-containing protein, partial [Anaerolineae bacterium]